MYVLHLCENPKEPEIGHVKGPDFWPGEGVPKDLDYYSEHGDQRKGELCLLHTSDH
jgi:hypothetical protein